MPAPIPDESDLVASVFGATGYLAGAFPGYRPRAGQIMFARAVQDALKSKRHLLAEAPTGTGKSLGYAAPASYYAARTGRPVVIVTANIALQEQIVKKDLPLLQKIVPWRFTYALMKGRNNYLCEDKRLDFEAEIATGKEPFAQATIEERRQLPVVREWARASAIGGTEEESGDASDLPFEPLPSVWRRFSVAADECKKNRCKQKHHCFGNRALETARQSLVVVTNYHLLFAHLAVYAQAGVDAVLPPFATVVLDEAHKAADIARDFFGFRITHETVRRTVRGLRQDEPNLVTALERASERYFGAMGALRRDKERYKARLTGDYTAPEQDR